MRGNRPGCGCWDVMAVRSMARIFSCADSWWEEGRAWMWSRMSVDLGMESAERISANIQVWGRLEDVLAGC